jgi:hypothetical protein
VLGRDHLDDNPSGAQGVARRDLDQIAVAQPAQPCHRAQRAVRYRHRHVPWQCRERPDVQVVGVQVRHDG